MTHGFPGLGLGDVTGATFIKGVVDGLKNERNAALTAEKVDSAMQAFVKQLQAKQRNIGAQQQAAGKAYMEENAKKEGVTTTASGMQYKVLTAGDGRKYDAAKDGKSATCKVSYEGRLIDGKVFDGSAEPVDFPIDRVVPGFSEALSMMPVGSEWEITLPSNLAYGPQGSGPIPANATLIFKMKLHDIKEAPGKAGNPIELTPEMLKQLQEQGLKPVEQ